jgi:glutamate--cysteine ligase
LLERIAPVAALLDARRGDTAGVATPGVATPGVATPHADALALQAAKLLDPEATPSARVLAEIKAEGGSFAAFGLRQSQAHAAYFRSHPPSVQDTSEFAAMAAQSNAQQAALELADKGSFDDFVQAYLASNLCPQL